MVWVYSTFRQGESNTSNEVDCCELEQPHQDSDITRVNAGTQGNWREADKEEYRRTKD